MKRYLLATGLSFLLSLFFCAVLIPILKKMKAGQNILSYVKEHEKKGGTPTMGGIAFVFAAVIATAVFSRAEKSLLLALAIGLSYMVVGLLDDLLKKKHKENLGLRAWQKLVFQTLIAVSSSLYCLRVGLTTLYIPFAGVAFELGWWILPLGLLTFLSTVNGVNLTDGLDGLAAGVSVPYFLAFGGILLLQGTDGELSTLCFAITGALLAYLLFNSPPASVFMGDTGSLALGGFASAVALFSGNFFYILIVGACFAFSVISVALQVIYYKASNGKRIFLMAPAHHHFQKKGYAESKISYAYFLVTLSLGGICILSLL